MMRSLEPRKKCMVGFLVVVLLIMGVWLVLQNREIEIRFDENGGLIVPDKPWYEGNIQYMKKVADLETRLLEMEKQDNFGGATPQETFDAFVEALKAGDTELASRYFVINDQKNELRELAKLSDEQLSDYLEMLMLGNNFSCNDGLGWCELYGTYQEKNVLIARFMYIEQAKVWKMESL